MGSAGSTSTGSERERSRPRPRASSRPARPRAGCARSRPGPGCGPALRGPTCSSRRGSERSRAARSGARPGILPRRSPGPAPRSSPTPHDGPAARAWGDARAPCRARARRRTAASPARRARIRGLRRGPERRGPRSSGHRPPEREQASPVHVEQAGECPAGVAELWLRDPAAEREFRTPRTAMPALRTSTRCWRSPACRFGAPRGYPRRALRSPTRGEGKRAAPRLGGRPRAPVADPGRSRSLQLGRRLRWLEGRQQYTRRSHRPEAAPVHRACSTAWAFFGRRSKVTMPNGPK